MLTGRYKNITEIPSEGRFQPDTTWGSAYMKRYWKEELFATVQALAVACEKHATTPADVAHRWMMHHSLMDGTKGDKVC